MSMQGILEAIRCLVTKQLQLAQADGGLAEEEGLLAGHGGTAGRLLQHAVKRAFTILLDLDEEGHERLNSDARLQHNVHGMAQAHLRLAKAGRHAHADALQARAAQLERTTHVCLHNRPHQLDIEGTVMRLTEHAGILSLLLSLQGSGGGSARSPAAIHSLNATEDSDACSSMALALGSDSSSGGSAIGTAPDSSVDGMEGGTRWINNQAIGCGWVPEALLQPPPQSLSANDATAGSFLEGYPISSSRGRGGSGAAALQGVGGPSSHGILPTAAGLNGGSMEQQVHTLMGLCGSRPCAGALSLQPPPPATTPTQPTASHIHAPPSQHQIQQQQQQRRLLNCAASLRAVAATTRFGSRGFFGITSASHVQGMSDHPGTGLPLLQPPSAPEQPQHDSAFPPAAKLQVSHNLGPDSSTQAGPSSPLSSMLPPPKWDAGSSDTFGGWGGSMVGVGGGDGPQTDLKANLVGGHGDLGMTAGSLLGRLGDLGVSEQVWDHLRRTSAHGRNGNITGSGRAPDQGEGPEGMPDSGHTGSETTVDLSALGGSGGESLMVSIVLLALQGVRSAYGIMHAALTRPDSPLRPSLASLLSRVAYTAQLRLRLASFVDCLPKCYATTAAGGGASDGPEQGSGTSGMDPVLCAFVGCVSHLLDLQGDAIRKVASAARDRGTQAAQRAHARRQGTQQSATPHAPRHTNQQPSSGRLLLPKVISKSGERGQGELERGSNGVGSKTAGNASAADLAAALPMSLLELCLALEPLRSNVALLAAMCRCTPALQDPGTESKSNNWHPKGAAAHGLEDPSAWELEGFPIGVHLLSYLHEELVQSGDGTVTASALRALFASALQPYHVHMRHWLYTQQAPEPLFSTTFPLHTHSTFGAPPVPAAQAALRASTIGSFPTHLSAAARVSAGPLSHQRTGRAQNGGQQARKHTPRQPKQQHEQQHTQQQQQQQQQQRKQQSGAAHQPVQGAFEDQHAVVGQQQPQLQQVAVGSQPGPLPHFLAHVAREFHVAGLQQRFLGNLESCVGDLAFRLTTQAVLESREASMAAAAAHSPTKGPWPPRMHKAPLGAGNQAMRAAAATATQLSTTANTLGAEKGMPAAQHQVPISTSIQPEGPLVDSGVPRSNSNDRDTGINDISSSVVDGDSRRGHMDKEDIPSALTPALASLFGSDWVPSLLTEGSTASSSHFGDSSMASLRLSMGPPPELATASASVLASSAPASASASASASALASSAPAPASAHASSTAATAHLDGAPAEPPVRLAGGGAPVSSVQHTPGNGPGGAEVRRGGVLVGWQEEAEEALASHPVAFEMSVLQQVSEISSYFAASAAAEVSHAVALLARRAEAARAAINEEGIAKAQEAEAARERARAAKDLQAAHMRVARAALLAEQRRAMDERAAAAVAAKEARIAEEQQALTDMVLREHAAAVAELRSEIARSRARDSAQAARRGGSMAMSNIPSSSVAAGLSSRGAGGAAGSLDVLSAQKAGADAINARRSALMRFEWRTQRMALSKARLAMIEAVELGELTDLQSTPALAAQAAREQSMAKALQLRAAPPIAPVLGPAERPAVVQVVQAAQAAQAANEPPLDHKQDQEAMPEQCEVLPAEEGSDQGAQGSGDGVSKQLGVDPPDPFGGVQLPIEAQDQQCDLHTHPRGRWGPPPALLPRPAAGLPSATYRIRQQQQQQQQIERQQRQIDQRRRVKAAQQQQQQQQQQRLQLRRGLVPQHSFRAERSNRASSSGYEDLTLPSPHTRSPGPKRRRPWGTDTVAFTIGMPSMQAEAAAVEAAALEADAQFEPGDGGWGVLSGSDGGTCTEGAGAASRQQRAKWGGPQQLQPPLLQQHVGIGWERRVRRRSNMGLASLAGASWTGGLFGWGGEGLGERRQGVQEAEGRRREEEEESLVAPVTSVMEVCVVQPVLAHYQLSSFAIWQLMMGELGLMQLCANLRRFFFLEDGHFAQLLADGLLARCKHGATSGSSPNMCRVNYSTQVLRLALEDACAGTTTQPVWTGAPTPLLQPLSAARQQRQQQHRQRAHGAPRLPTDVKQQQQQLQQHAIMSVAVVTGQEATAGLGIRAAGPTRNVLRAPTPLHTQAAKQQTKPHQQQCPRPYDLDWQQNVADAALLTYDVPWPLSAVIGGSDSQQLAAYADVASALLRLRMCAGTLHNAWMTLGKPSLAQRLGRGAGEGAYVQQAARVDAKLRGVRAWLAQAMHWVGAVQCASQGRLLGGCWTGLVQGLGYEAPSTHTQNNLHTNSSVYDGRGGVRTADRAGSMALGLGGMGARALLQHGVKKGLDIDQMRSVHAAYCADALAAVFLPPRGGLNREAVCASHAAHCRQQATREAAAAERQRQQRWHHYQYQQHQQQGGGDAIRRRVPWHEMERAQEEEEAAAFAAACCTKGSGVRAAVSAATQACEAFAAAAAVFAEHTSRADQKQQQHQKEQDMGAGAFAALKAAHTHFAHATRQAYLVMCVHASAATTSPVLDYCAGFSDNPATRLEDQLAQQAAFTAAASAAAASELLPQLDCEWYARMVVGGRD